MMQTTTQNVVVVPSHDGSTYPNYSKKSSLVLGSVHLVGAFVVFILSVVGVALMGPDGPKGSLVFSMICNALVCMHARVRVSTCAYVVLALPYRPVKKSR